MIQILSKYDKQPTETYGSWNFVSDKTLENGLKIPSAKCLLLQDVSNSP